MNAHDRHARMYEQYGVDPLKRKCSACSNFLRNDRGFGKCIVYGLSGCEATDWSGKADACGFINKVHHGMSVIDLYKHAPKPKKEMDDGVIDGQISLFDEEAINE